ncbi:heme ABC transporter substrate-binding protein IsdE [Cytobacillus sp. FSL M8-0252]|uniref:heme ABC transporter substrate-binding protein IsdE n=1 Tax=Cytobacillus sp. FSL M8-0252 TaxID=2921621 RepID=UPI0030FC957B
MKRIQLIFYIMLLFFIAGCAGGQTAGEEKEAKDEGQTEEEKVRIVATTTAIAEVMNELELDLVGIPTTSFPLPERYQDVVEVGNPMKPDMEVIKTLNADKVLSVTTLEYDLKDSFVNAGIETEFLNFQSVESMITTIKELGGTYHREAQAEALSQNVESKIEEVQEKTAQYQSPKVLILLGIPGSYLVATENSYVGNLVKVAGGENAITGFNEEYISANTEYLHEADADVILRLSHGMPDEVVEMFNSEFKDNNIWQHFNAVKNNRVYDLREPLFATTANLNVTNALDELVDILYVD